ncbi:hypothetical protein WSK_4073 [Novosphingobium sp. Rr 2-17]|uniref:hypothetical protein n=1 Tax=Novosphingobium sp. Rr 2-17 TaxID=555793 RepID=UPI0002699F34|nr:hypothetical protein [Novosphingobium sp. Rr 2-17]EIZ77341.1 hypothetical protein WSK_4073 [Novosphingobium sp. Rr 2-17]
MSEAKALTSAFGKAVLTGTLAGGGPFLIITVPYGFIAGTIISSPAQTLIGMSLPLWATAALVVPLSLFIGLPVHFVIRRLDIWYMPVLVLVAGFIGFMTPWVLAYLWQGSVNAGLCLWAAGVGAITAYKWASALSRIY